jgi:hypothetical protein
MEWPCTWHSCTPHSPSNFIDIPNPMTIQYFYPNSTVMFHQISKRADIQSLIFQFLFSIWQIYNTWFASELLSSWFQTFAMFCMLYVFFWVIPRRLNFICRHFGTLCLFSILQFNYVAMVNAVFRYCWFVGLCQSYMSIVLFDTELDWLTALSNINPAIFTWDAVYSRCS